jgi:hypothetical protein
VGEGEVLLSAIKSAASQMAVRRIERAKLTGAWLTVMPDKLNGTVLSAEEFRDSLRLRFGLTPSSLPSQCDGCGQRFTVEHAMTCRKGGMIISRHNDVCAEWGHLCAQALSPSAVSDEPLINSGRDYQAEADATGTEVGPELRGDIAAHGFWRRGTTAIFDVRITDTDCKSNRARDPAKILLSNEKEKRDRYLEPCLRRRKHFTPLVFSIDGLRGAEAAAASQKLASLLSAKWKRTYSQVCGFVRSRITLALVRAASRCLRADRTRSARAPVTPWDNGAGLSLYR